MRCCSTKNKCRPQGERESPHASKFLLGEDMPARVEDKMKELEEESRKCSRSRTTKRDRSVTMRPKESVKNQETQQEWVLRKP